MTQPDWGKAPNGATHWGPDSHSWREAWYMLSQDRLWRWHNGVRWGLVPNDAPRFADRIAELVTKPVKPRWRYHWGGHVPIAADKCPAVILRSGWLFGDHEEDERTEWCDAMWDHSAPKQDHHIIAYLVPD